MAKHIIFAIWACMSFDDAASLKRRSHYPAFDSEWDRRYAEEVFDCAMDEELLKPAGDDVTGLDTVHVAYSSSAKGFEQLLVSMVSMSRQLAAPEKCVIHVIVPKEDMATASSLVECFAHELEERRKLEPGPSGVPAVKLYEERELPFTYNRSHLAEAIDWKGAAEGYMNTPSLARLQLGEYLASEDVPRVLWLDIDTVVRADVAPLYRMHMEHAFAAVPNNKFDFKFCVEGTGNKEVAKIVGLTPAMMFNSGVLMIDLAKWSAKIKEYEVMTWGDELKWAFADEVPLNMAFLGEYDKLDFRWNLHAIASEKPITRKCYEEVKILHFNAGPKCWRKKCKASANGRLYENTLSQCADTLLSGIKTWCDDPDFCKPVTNALI